MANVILNVHSILWGFSFVLFYLRVLRRKRQDAGEIPYAAGSRQSGLHPEREWRHTFYILLSFLLAK